MTIHIKPFEEIEKINIDENTKDNPLKDFKLPKGLFKQRNDDFFKLLEDWETQHWERLLNNRLLSLNRNFGYAIYYYQKGIPDDEWFISPGKEGKSVQYFPHFKDKHYSNHFNFTYFVDVFFLQSFTLYETIGHLLFKKYGFKIAENKPSDQVSFNNAIYKLKKINQSLYRSLNKVKYSCDYQRGVKMRNNIAHNHPPHQIDSGISNYKGLVAFGVGKYTTSNEIKEIMIGLLKSIRKTFEVLEKNL